MTKEQKEKLISVENRKQRKQVILEVNLNREDDIIYQSEKISNVVRWIENNME